MVSPALDEAVARSHEHLPLVHEGPDLAVQDEGVIHRAGLVHAGMPGGARVHGVAGSHGREGFPAIEGGRHGGIGRKVDDAEDRAARGRLEHDGSRRRVGRARVAGGRAVGDPEVDEGQARHARQLEHVGRRAVGQDHRFPFSIDTGQDPAHRPRHGV